MRTTTANIAPCPGSTRSGEAINIATSARAGGRFIKSDPMLQPSEPAKPGNPLTGASRLLTVLGIGLALLALLLPPNPPDCENPDAACSVYGPGERRARDYQLQKIGGQAMVLADRFHTWAMSWLQGRKLIMLLAILCFGSAAVCARLGRVADLQARE
ncbi:MAG: hypothetical protein ACO3BH_01450 [Quisquiliibacterium sp.]